MREVLLATFLSVGLVTFAHANPPPEMCSPDFDKMADELHVDAKQKPAFVDVMKSHHEQKRKLHEQMREQMKEKMTALDDESNKKLAGILTPEQLQAFEKKREEMREYHRSWDHEGMDGMSHGKDMKEHGEEMKEHGKRHMDGSKTPTEKPAP